VYIGSTTDVVKRHKNGHIATSKLFDPRLIGWKCTIYLCSVNYLEWREEKEAKYWLARLEAHLINTYKPLFNTHYHNLGKFQTDEDFKRIKVQLPQNLKWAFRETSWDQLVTPPVPHPNLLPLIQNINLNNDGNGNNSLLALLQ